MLKADLHTHTVNSGDGLSTIDEMAREAARRGLSVLGITPHGPGTPGSYPENAYSVFDRVPDVLHGVRILMSAELNIADDDGSLMGSEKAISHLRYGLAGLHFNFEKHEEQRNTRAIVNAMKDPRIDIISHPYMNFDVDIEAIADAAVKYGKLLELNNSNFKYNLTGDQVFMVKAKKMVEIIRENDHSLIINSDAHIASDVGEDMAVLAHRKELGLTDKMIINTRVDELLERLGIDGHR